MMLDNEKVTDDEVLLLEVRSVHELSHIVRWANLGSERMLQQF